jgi:branched-chain amino acid transport system permease protein
MLGALPAHRIARLGVARSFQSPMLVEAMTPLDAVTLARLAASGGLFRTERRAALARGEAMALLAGLGAAGVATTECGRLPHGLRRRVELARALALAPRFLLLDEPSAGLAPDEIAALAGFLRTLSAHGQGLLIVEHNLAFLMPLADRIVCLDRGAVIGAGTAAEVARDPKIKAAYLGDEVILSSDRS